MIGLLWRRAGQVTNSLVFRIGLLLALGLILASSAALGVAMQVHWHDLLTMRNEQVVASSADIAQRLQRDPDHTEELLSTGRILGARDAPQSWQMSQPDEDLGELLRARLGPASAAQAMSMPHEQCFPYFDMRLKAAGTSDFALPDCWFVRFRDPVGHWRALSIDLPTIRHPNSFPNAIYISLLVLACASLAFLVTSLLAWPLRRLTEAAHTFSLSVQPDAIPEVGPREVKSALVTFNLMQQRIRAGFTERTHMLGAIAHDLQTPLTRMRLRVEQIDEEALRGRLIADLSVMQRLVRDGLDLARATESHEPFSVVDLDSIVSSVAEDAAEFGAPVVFEGGCGGKARVRPGALVRCLTNLVDNAVKYGGSARLATRVEGGRLMVIVRDGGPGIPEDLLEEVFKPFFRHHGGHAGETGARLPVGDCRAGGTGLGLAIARAQAQALGASLSLANHPDGGLEAQVVLGL